MDVSLCIASNRPGGLDLTLPSLALQEFSGSWECVFADELYEQRKDALTSYAKQWNVPLKHVPAPPHPYISPASSFNAALKEAQGELVIIAGDYSFFPPNLLQTHWNNHKAKTGYYLTASYVDHHPPAWRENIKPDSFSAFKEPFNPAALTDISTYARFEERWRFISHWVAPHRGVVADEWVLGLIGVPRRLVVDVVNGFDEVFCGGRGYSDHDLAHRFKLAGIVWTLATDLIIHRIVQDSPIFAEKKAHRTNETNRKIREQKHFLLQKGFLTINSHRGIRDLRNKQDRRVAVEGGGASGYAHTLSELLQAHGNHVSHTNVNFNYSSITDYIVYGVSPPDVHRCFELAPRMRTWLWWTGTDLINLVNNTFGIPVPFMRSYPHLKHICHHERQRKMLEGLDIEAAIVPPSLKAYPQSPMPSSPAVLCYLPSNRPDVYQQDATVEVMKKLPDVKFIVCGNKEYLGSLPSNAEQVGWVSVEQLYPRSSLLLRLTAWDGFPEMIVDMKLLGRRVVTTYPYEHCASIKTVDEAVEEVQKGLASGEDMAGREYYQEHYSPEMTVKRFEEVLFDVEG